MFEFMRGSLFFIICILFIQVFCTENTSVVVLDSDNYTSFIESHSDVLVKYYAPWCKHCQELAADYIEISKELKESCPNLITAEVDVMDNPKVGRIMQIQGIPTIAYFKNSKSVVLSGTVNKNTIKDFALESYQNSHETVITNILNRKVDGLKATITKAQHTLVVYCSDKTPVILNAVDEAINEILNLTRVVIFERDVADAMKASFPSLILYKSIDDFTVYDGLYRAADIRRWVLIDELPLIVPYTPTYSRKVFNPQLDVKVHLMYFAPEHNPNQNVLKHTEELKRVAMQFRSKIVILHIPAENPRLLDYFGIRSRQVPTVGIVSYEHSPSQKYMFKDSFTEQNVIKFINQYFKGELKPFFRSEDEPTVNPGPVYTVVGTTFKKFVYETPNDVVVKFYSNFDGKSSDLEPVFKDVANSYIMDKQITFAAVDVTKNEIQGVSSDDFPKIVLYKTEDNFKKSIVYNGEGEVEPIKQFIESNRTPKNKDNDEL